MLLMKKKINNVINEAVIKGQLPLAFFNSEIIKRSNFSANKQKTEKVIKKYLQVNLPEAESPILISKIHEIF